MFEERFLSLFQSDDYHVLFRFVEHTHAQLETVAYHQMEYHIPNGSNDGSNGGGGGGGSNRCIS